jgi:hypothetical protein
MSGLVLMSLIAIAVINLNACGGGLDNVRIAINEPQPEQFIRGWFKIQTTLRPITQIKRAALLIRHQEEFLLVRELVRQEDPPEEWEYDWDTAKEKDGPYEIELQVLLSNNQTRSQKVGNIWIINRPAAISISGCLNPPLVTRDRLEISIDWQNVPEQMPPTAVELFVQGKSIGTKEKSPYIFGVDLSEFKSGDEIYVTAVTVRGVYRGSTAVCSVLVDREGPRVRFVYPAQKGMTVPAKFYSTLEIEEEYGIKEVQVLLDGQIVGKLVQPPFQVPVDLSHIAHGSRVVIKASAIDLAGNETSDPPAIEVVVDARAPRIEIIKPQANTNHQDKIEFEVRITDDTENNIGLVDFYISDENDQRLDNILHTTGDKNSGDIYMTTVGSLTSLYGFGRRNFEVVARDLNGNISTQKIELIFGCQHDSECFSRGPQYQCRGNRCLIPHKLNDRCNYEFACEKDLVCHFGGLFWCSKEKVGICRKVYDKSQGGCFPGTFRLPQTSGPDICFPGDPCDPFTYNCNKNEQCTPWDINSFVCLPVGPGREGEPCDTYACTENKNCGKGLACIPSAHGEARGVCYRLCDQEFPLRDCHSGQLCISYPLQDKFVNSMGYCRTN